MRVDEDFRLNVCDTVRNSPVNVYACDATI